MKNTTLIQSYEGEQIYVDKAKENNFVIVIKAHWAT